MTKKGKLFGTFYRLTLIKILRYVPSIYMSRMFCEELRHVSSKATEVFMLKKYQEKTNFCISLLSNMTTSQAMLMQSVSIDITHDILFIN